MEIIVSYEDSYFSLPELTHFYVIELFLVMVQNFNAGQLPNISPLWRPWIDGHM